MKVSMLRRLAIAAILSAPALVVAQNSVSTLPIQEDEREVLFPPASLIEQGHGVAEMQCARCHGMDGMGNGSGQPYLAGQRAVYLYRELRAYQERGRDNKSMQHASSVLNDKSMLAVSAYYANLIAKPVSLEPAAEFEPLADDPFAEIRPELKKCVKCHGESGNSTASGMPNLTAQSPGYFEASMLAYVDGSRSHKLMGRLAGGLDEETIRQMGIFYAVQPPSRTGTQGDGKAASGKRAAEECATCHGADGNTTATDIPSLAGQDARYFVKAMQAYKEGSRGHEPMMEAVAGLSESVILDLASYYAQQKPLRRDTRAPVSTAQWVQRCDRCHGINGNSTDPRFPMLAGQNELYLRKAMRSYTAGERSASVMHAMSAPLSRSDIDQISRHYATQTPKSVVYVDLPCEDNRE